MVLSTEDAAGPQELYRSEHVVVRQVATADRDRWVVTFDNYGIGHGFDRPGFGEAWLQSQGLSAIHVLGRAEDWYQYPDIEEALACVRAAVAGASRVMTYGSSMGAYAALRFAEPVGATAVLAFSPQYTLDPKTAGHDARWSQDAHRIRWMPQWNGAVRCRPVPVIIYDPVGPDRWHAERFSRDTATTAITLPYTGHPVTSFLGEIGALGGLILETLEGSLDPRALRRHLRAQRGRSGVYLGHLAEKAWPRRQALSLALAHRAAEVSNGNDLARLSLARLLSASGRHDEALPIFESLVDYSGRRDAFLVAYAKGLAAANRLPEARAIADEVIAAAGDTAHIQAWAASIYWANGDADDARRMIDNAIALDPGNATLTNLRRDYQPSMARPVRRAVRSVAWRPLARWVMKRLSGKGGLMRRSRVDDASGTVVGS